MGRLTAMVASATLCACAAPRPVPPVGGTEGAVVARVVFKGQTLPNFLRHPADQVYYARVTSSGEPDLDHPLPSNFRKGGYVYWLNAPPGRYVPIAAAYTELRLRYLARLGRDAQRDMDVVVRPGMVAFAGETLLRTQWQGLGAALLHLAERGWLRPRPAEVVVTTHLTDRSAPAEGSSLRAAGAALAGTTWLEAVRARIDELGPPPPLYEGWLRRRLVPRAQLDRFSYIDTLKWGPPKGAEPSWEWREPKRRAAISVTFVKPGDLGFVPLEDRLADMRTAGSGDDEHILYDVKVSSRSAKAARYTTSLYPKQDLPGGAGKSVRTEVILVPDPDGYYLLRYRAPVRAFGRFWPDFVKFVRYLVLEKRPPPEPKT